MSPVSSPQHRHPVAFLSISPTESEVQLESYPVRLLIYSHFRFLRVFQLLLSITMPLTGYGGISTGEDALGDVNIVQMYTAFGAADVEMCRRLSASGLRP